MKGSAFKLNNVATKSALKMEEEGEKVTTEKEVNPHPPRTFKHALWEQTNLPKDEMLEDMQRSQRWIEEGTIKDPKTISNMRRIMKAQQNILFPGGGMGGFDIK